MFCTVSFQAAGGRGWGGQCIKGHNQNTVDNYSRRVIIDTGKGVMRIFAKVSGLYCCMSVAGIRVIKGFSRVLESTACTRLPSSETFSFPFEPKQTLECQEVTSPPWTVFLQLLCISCRWCSGCTRWLMTMEVESDT